jgi:hypothetical protein
LPEGFETAVRASRTQAFLTGYRTVMWISAGMAAASALIAAVTMRDSRNRDRR